MSSDVSSIYPQDKINSSKLNKGDVYEFENFRLDALRLMLYRNEQPIALAPKVVETLLALVERRGEVVSKEELMERLWRDSFVEESNLTQNIYLLRKTLGTNSEGKTLIETFRRRGYRFNGAIKELKGADFFDGGWARAKIAAEEIKAANPPEKISASSVSTKKVLLVGAIASCGLLILALALAPRFFNRSEQTEAASGITLKRLTPDIYAYNPAISPDGKYLAYAEIKDGKSSVWIKDINLGSAVQLLPPISGGYKGLQFSPDGSELYYLTGRENAPNHVIARVSVSGGKTPREITSDAISPFAVSPDNRHLAFINGQGKLLIINTDGSGGGVLKQRERGRWFNGWDAEMSFSPDGDKIAVCGSYIENGQTLSELIEVSVADGAERRIETPPYWREMSGVVWLRDGNNLLVTARETQGQPVQIWSLSRANGEAKRLTNDLNDYHYISASADGRQIVAEQSLGNLNIWMAEASDLQNIRQLTFGKAAKDGFSGVAVLPDGKIVYSSTRSGNVDLWLTDADGANQRQLTANAGTLNARPQATADGRYIVFVSSRTGTSRIWRMDADGGNPKQLTFGDSAETRPALAPDGRWVFYTAGEGSDQSFIWKVPIDGGAPIRVSAHNYAWGAQPSPDGKFIAYNHNQPGAAHPWKVGVMSAEGGEPLKLFDLHVYAGILNWTADSKAVLYIHGENPNVWQQPLEGGAARPLTNFKNERLAYFAFAPDYSRAAFSRGNLTTEAVLISNFR